jgi:hypothetical protein
MAQQGKTLLFGNTAGEQQRSEGALLFWIRLLVFFLALNIAVYSLQLAAHVSGCTLADVNRVDQAHRVHSVPSVQGVYKEEGGSLDPTDPRLPLRTVKVLAVADGWYQATHPNWQETIAATVAKVSALYHSKFGIAFALVDIRAWNGPVPFTLPGQLTALQDTYPVTADYEIVLGFTTGSGLFIAGISEILGNHLVVADTPLHDTSVLLAHEFGHIFGARDSFTISSVQLFLGPFAPPFLSEDFRAAIRRHKHRLFYLPPAPPRKPLAS